MRWSKITVMLSLATFVALPASAADAASLGTVDVVRIGHGANLPIDIYGGGLDGQELFSGVYMLNKTTGTGAGTQWPNGLMSAFCIEIEQPAPNVVTHYNVLNPESNYSPLLNETLGSAKAGYLSELWGRYYDTSWEGGGSHTYSQSNSAAAFAAAVWEIVYEDLPGMPSQWDVSADGTPGIPGFASLNVDAGLANSWLHSLDGNGTQANLAVFSNSSSQNYLVAVPEPTTVVLLGLGGVVSLLKRRRRTA